MRQVLWFLFLLSAVLVGCRPNTQTGETKPSDAQGTVTRTGDDEPDANQGPSGYWERLRMVEYRNASGALEAERPYPVSWHKTTNSKAGDPHTTGPEGLEIRDYQMYSFMYQQDHQMQQIYAQNGTSMRIFPGVEEVIQQDVIPSAARQGLTFKRYYEVPEVSAADLWYDDQLYKVMPMEKYIAAFGIEFVNNAGNPFFFLLHLNVTNGQGFQSWSYYGQLLQANPNYFDKAVKQFIFSLANTRFAMEPIMAYNQSEIQKAGQSWAAHEQRMRNNWANFEAHQRNHINKSNAINDAIMSGWRERNASSDRMHNQAIDAIREETNVSNVATGQQYKVAAGYNQYWMNADGEYISTDQQNYNPNLDEMMNHQQWQQLKQTRQ